MSAMTPREAANMLAGYQMREPWQDEALMVLRDHTRTVAPEGGNLAEQWRVGRRNPHTVYRQHGDEPRGYEHADHDDSLGYFRHPEDAQRAVDAVNRCSPAPSAATPPQEGEAPRYEYGGGKNGLTKCVCGHPGVGHGGPDTVAQGRGRQPDPCRLCSCFAYRLPSDAPAAPPVEGVAASGERLADAVATTERLIASWGEDDSDSRALRYLLTALRDATPAVEVSKLLSDVEATLLMVDGIVWQDVVPRAFVISNGDLRMSYDVNNFARYLLDLPMRVVSTLAVGDPVETVEQLDALPVGAGVRSDGGMRVRYERLHSDGWYCAGDHHRKPAHEVLRFGAHLVDLPGSAS